MTAATPGPLTPLDESLLRGTRELLGGTPGGPVARALSHPGAHAPGWIALGAAGWASGRRRHDWASGVAGVVAAHGAAVLVKRVVRRARPDLPDVPPLVATPSRLSFPSAHASSTAAAAVGFAPLLGAAPLGATTAAMATSRVLLGVHYPSDVAVGVALGSSVALLVRRMCGPLP